MHKCKSIDVQSATVGHCIIYTAIMQPQAHRSRSSRTAVSKLSRF